MMFNRSSLILTTVIITSLTSTSYTTLATDTNPTAGSLNNGIGLPEKKRFADDDSWIKHRQNTAAQDAAEKAREERLAEAERMGKQAATSQDQSPKSSESLELEKKPEETAKTLPSPQMATTPRPSMPTVLTKPTWQELAKQRRAERLKREQMNAGKVEEQPIEKPTVAQEAAEKARDERLAEANRMGSIAAGKGDMATENKALKICDQAAQEVLNAFDIWERENPELTTAPTQEMAKRIQGSRDEKDPSIIVEKLSDFSAKLENRIKREGRVYPNNQPMAPNELIAFQELHDKIAHQTGICRSVIDPR